ncbi:hypothetical protein BD779DRAFT_1681313 [Infundibulicybe gibba]|nr:hypothetical protein BD779DRAFT_1681313 [Infundibulicybe gibba]
MPASGAQTAAPPIQADTAPSTTLVHHGRFRKSSWLKLVDVHPAVALPKGTHEQSKRGKHEPPATTPQMLHASCASDGSYTSVALRPALAVMPQTLYTLQMIHDHLCRITTRARVCAGSYASYALDDLYSSLLHCHPRFKCLTCLIHFG